jgi:hypothetical protein
MYKNKCTLAGISSLVLLLAACNGSGFGSNSNSAGASNINPPTTLASNQSLTPMTGSNAIISPFNLPANQLAQMDVYSSDGKFIGNAGQVLADSSGRPVAMSVEAGGFLGLGSHEVIVPLGQLRAQGTQLVTNYTRAQIDTLPPYSGR